MTPIFAVALVAVVIITVAYVIAIYRFGFQREFFLVPPAENIDDLSDAEREIVWNQIVIEKGLPGADRVDPFSDRYTIVEDADGYLHGFPVGKPCAVCAGPHDAARWPERPVRERERVRVQRRRAS